MLCVGDGVQLAVSMETVDSRVMGSLSGWKCQDICFGFSGNRYQGQPQLSSFPILSLPLALLSPLLLGVQWGWMSGKGGNLIWKVRITDPAESCSVHLPPLYVFFLFSLVL
jgi:hypothetical protein